METNKRLVFLILAVVILALEAAFVLWSRPPKGYSGKMESITAAIPKLEPSALLLIAEDQHFFGRNGLNLTLHEPDLFDESSPF